MMTNSYIDYCTMMCSGNEKYGQTLYKILTLSNNKSTVGNKDWVFVPVDEISSIFALEEMEFREFLSFLRQRKLATSIDIVQVIHETKKSIYVRLNRLLVGVTSMIDDYYYEGVFFGTYFSSCYFAPTSVSELSSKTIEELAAVNWGIEELDFGEKKLSKPFSVQLEYL